MSASPSAATVVRAASLSRPTSTMCPSRTPTSAGLPRPPLPSMTVAPVIARSSTPSFRSFELDCRVADDLAPLRVLVAQEGGGLGRGGGRGLVALVDERRAHLGARQRLAGVFAQARDDRPGGARGRKPAVPGAGGVARPGALV